MYTYMLLLLHYSFVITTAQDRRVRFPEFVYAFFEPPRTLLAESDAETRHALLKQADDNRWALYYGVKVTHHFFIYFFSHVSTCLCCT
jgi:hypothetical protein